jgi:hypothetical protein
MIKLIFYAALMQAGSQRARGIVEVIKASRAVRAEWARCQGRYGWEPTVSNLKRFLDQTYGVSDLNSDGDPAERFNRAQLDQIFEAVARNLIASGAVKFGF